METWFQLLHDELKRIDDDRLWNWPSEWWEQLLAEGMNPVQAVRYTTRVMYGKINQTIELHWNHRTPIVDDALSPVQEQIVTVQIVDYQLSTNLC